MGGVSLLLSLSFCVTHSHKHTHLNPLSERLWKWKQLTFNSRKSTTKVPLSKNIFKQTQTHYLTNTGKSLNLPGNIDLPLKPGHSWRGFRSLAFTGVAQHSARVCVRCFDKAPMPTLFNIQSLIMETDGHTHSHTNQIKSTYPKCCPCGYSSHTWHSATECEHIWVWIWSIMPRLRCQCGQSWQRLNLSKNSSRIWQVTGSLFTFRLWHMQ